MNADVIQMAGFYAAVFCLWCGAAVGAMYLAWPDKIRLAFANAFVVIGFVFLTIFFLLRWRSIGFMPVSSMFESLTFFIWAIVLVYLIVEYSFDLPSLSSFILPIIAIFTFAALFVSSRPEAMNVKLKSIWFYLHVGFAFLGYATFAVACATSIMYLLQRRQLKAKKTFDSVFHRLPPLEVLDNLNQKLINMGFPFFTIAIGAGVYWALDSDILGPNWSNDPKIVFTIITWLLYAALFHIRLFAVARGKRVAQLTIIAFAFIVVTFLGTRYLASGSHEFLK